MPRNFAPESHAQLTQELSNALSGTTVQTLRTAAKQSGWPLKGVAKAELVEQMLGYLSDATRMAAVFEKLTDEERDVLTWLNALGLAGDPVKPLQAALAQAAGRQITQKAIGLAIQKLMERCLLFFGDYAGYFVPGIYAEWLPTAAAPRLLYAGEPGQAPSFTLAGLIEKAQNLLSAIEVSPPEAAAVVQPAAPIFTASGRGNEVITPRPGLVAAETLKAWGYLSTEDRHLTRFLLELMTSGGLCKIAAHAHGRRLEISAPALSSWEVDPPAERLQRLRRWWLQSAAQPAGSPASTWNELDLALHLVTGYVLRPAAYWMNPTHLTSQMAVLRVWLLSLISAWQPNTWYSVERLSNLVYHLRRDLLKWEEAGSSWRWCIDKTPLDPSQMTFDVWYGTYGKLIEAWLTGPATWLAFVQVGYTGSRPVAFRYLNQVPAGDLASLPADALRFPSAEVAVLANTWQTGELRQLLRSIAVETARDRGSTAYRLSAEVFRQSLKAGTTAARICESFSAAGFPLPEAMQNMLQGWQERAGRHQLYDNLAVIEFGEDMHPEEVKAIAGLGLGKFYPVSPRCLIVLAPDFVPALVDDLRRRGYTPQVLP